MNRRQLLKSAALPLIAAPSLLLPKMICEAGSSLPPFTLQQGVGHMFNYSPASVLRIKSAIEKVRAGVASGYIAIVADSNGRGTGSAAGGTQGYSGWPNILAQLLTQAGVKAQCENWFGMGGYGGSFSSYDNRLVFSGSGFSQPNGSGLVTVGGWMTNATAAGSLTFTTVSNCDTVDIYWFGASGNGTVNYQIDGGATTNIVTNQATSGLYKTTVALGSLGIHAIALNWVSGSSYIVGMDAYDNSTPLLHILNWGWHGSTTAGWTNQMTGSTTSSGSKWIPLNCINQFFAPAGIIGPALGINDMNTSNNLSAATVNANKQLLLSSWASTTDTILLTEGPSAAATEPSLAVQATYNAMDWALAGQNGIPMLDEFGWMSNETTMEGYGLYNTDHLHKTRAGHALTARMVANALLAIS